MNEFKHNSEENYIEIIQRLVKAIVVLLVIIVVLLVLNITGVPTQEKEISKKTSEHKTEKLTEK
jgi:competence protein ComGC